jgi:hypothetical protein
MALFMVTTHTRITTAVYTVTTQRTDHTNHTLFTQEQETLKDGHIPLQTLTALTITTMFQQPLIMEAPAEQVERVVWEVQEVQEHLL